MNAKVTMRAIAAAVALAFTTPVLAEGNQTRAGIENAGWGERELRNGISLNRLVGMDVRSRDGRALGEVQNVIVTAQGRIAAIVVETGGFMDIGDRHFRIPFDQVAFTRDTGHVTVPLTRSTAQKYRDNKIGERVATGAGEYRLSRLKDGAFWLRDGTRAGNVEDLIASRNGEIKGVVVDTDFGPGGLRTVPFDIARFDFEQGTYNADFDRNDLARWSPWDYGRNNVAAPRNDGVGATGTAGEGAVQGGTSRPMRAPREARG